MPDLPTNITPPCPGISTREAWTYQMICDYYGISEITLEDANRIHEDYIKARRSWIAEIRKDAEKEFAMGDVEEEVFRNFVDSLDQEIEYEN